MAIVRAYYWLAKPGIVYGNTIALLIGFFFYSLVSSTTPDMLLFVGGVFGTALVMASACVANNIYDRDMDIHMARTNTRALVTGNVGVMAAVVYSIILLLIGSSLLYLTNPTAMYLGLAGWVTYAVIYTYAKRFTYHATLIGTVPGAIPPLIGYYAAGGTSFAVAFVLFMVLVAWQMVHFYAIAIFRQQDYAKANIPVVTQVKGVDRTIEYIQIWAYLSGIVLLATTVFGTLLYTLLTVLLFAWWFRVTLYQGDDTLTWSRKVFFSSLKFLVAWLAITVLSALVGLL
jgi:protoheme IX farnesyltransferase